MTSNGTSIYGALVYSGEDFTVDNGSYKFSTYIYEYTSQYAISITCSVSDGSGSADQGQYKIVYD